MCVCVGGGGGGGGGGDSKVVSYKYDGAAPHAVALYHPGNFFNTEKKRTCIFLDWIALNIHLSIMFGV